MKLNSPRMEKFDHQKVCFFTKKKKNKINKILPHNNNSRKISKNVYERYDDFTTTSSVIVCTIIHLHKSLMNLLHITRFIAISGQQRELAPGVVQFKAIKLISLKCS